MTGRQSRSTAPSTLHAAYTQPGSNGGEALRSSTCGPPTVGLDDVDLAHRRTARCTAKRWGRPLASIYGDQI